MSLARFGGSRIYIEGLALGKFLMEPNAPITLEVDLSDVPDSIPPVQSGRVYDLEITKIEIKPTKKDATKEQIDFTGKILNEGEDKGRFMNVMCWDWKNNKYAKVTLRRLVLSTGGDPTKALNIGALQGKVFKATTEANVYTDESGTTKQNTKIGQILIPGDAGF